MQKLKLHQLSKQQVAEREMNAIKGGAANIPNTDTNDGNGNDEFGGICFGGGPWNGSRAWNMWNDVCCCLPGDFYPKHDMVVI